MNKTVVITGTSSGIGKAAALHFAKKGWNVAATMREITADPDFAAFASIIQYQLDVTDKKSIESALSGITGDFGTIDVLVNNAGFATVGPFEASTPHQIEKQFAVNVFGVMDLSRMAIPIFRTQGFGGIVNISSMGGRLAFPLYSAYHAAKWAVEGFSESLMYELRPLNIRVKLIEPGTIKTQFIGRSEVRFAKKGLDAYDNYASKIIDGYHQTYNHAAAPDGVAKAIYRAANSKSSKLRYSVGQPAPILLALRRILPERLFFILIRLGTK